MRENGSVNRSFSISEMLVEIIWTFELRPMAAERSKQIFLTSQHSRPVTIQASSSRHSMGLNRCMTIFREKGGCVIRKYKNGTPGALQTNAGPRVFVRGR